MSVRLDQFLSARTMYTRRELRQLIRGGKVTVDGKKVLLPDQPVKPDVQTVCLLDTPVPGDPYLYVLLNKPEGYVTSVHEPGQHTVLELVPAALRRKALAPVGRLDKASTGMLLLTDDGQLSHQLTAARSHSAKYYRIRLARPWEDSYREQVAAGITLADGAVCLPALAEPVPGTSDEALICLHEGKYHQVRRMFAAMGNHVEALSRIAIGGFSLPDSLPLGGCMVLEEKDVQKMLNQESSFSDLLQTLC